MSEYCVMYTLLLLELAVIVVGVGTGLSHENWTLCRNLRSWYKLISQKSVETTIQYVLTILCFAIFMYGTVPYKCTASKNERDKIEEKIKKDCCLFYVMYRY